MWKVNGDMQTEKCCAKAREYIKKNQMAEQGDGILAAVSGGADSVCLLWVLHDLAEEMGIRLAAFHLNHGLRGAEADRDEQYVRKLCEEMGIPCHVVREDVRTFARTNSMTEEEAGRVLRYRYLEEAAETFGCNKIATAHHKDDDAETVLMNLFRGTGFQGLGGIRPLRQTNTGRTVIRPLLGLSREEIEAYLEQKGCSWCEDSTNSELQYARNKVRNVLLPWIKEEVNDRAAEHVLRMASLASQADVYFKAEAAKILGEDRTRVSNGVFDAQPELIKGYLVREMIAEAAGQEKDITARHVEAVCSLTGPGGGTHVDLPYGLQAVRGYEWLEIRLRDQVPVYGENMENLLEMRVFPWKKDREIPKNQYTKWFDYDKIKGTLCVRTRETGDYFLYSGGKRKLLKRYFIDEKIPEEMRDRIPLLVDGNHVLWVIGHRISEYYKVNEDTCTILEVTLCKGEK